MILTNYKQTKGSGFKLQETLGSTDWFILSIRHHATGLSSI